MFKRLNRFWLALMGGGSKKKERWFWVKRLIKLGFWIWKLLEFLGGDGTS